MPPKRFPRRASARRRQLDPQWAAAEAWEDRLDLRRELLISLIVVPVGAACTGLLIWHRAFVQPLGASPVSVLLILLTAVAVIGGLWHFVIREPTRLWVGIAMVIHFPLAFAPIIVLDSTETMVLNERGVTETCTVAQAERFVARSRSGVESLVRHQVRCQVGTYRRVTAPEDRYDIGTRMTVVYDPEGIVRAQFEKPSDAGVDRNLTIAVGLLLFGIGARILYIWWRVRRSRKRGAGRRRGR